MKFAVVGRSNKGKSSIVATLSENDDILVAPTPRTTLRCQEFSLEVAGRKLLTVIDTPGFEEAHAVLEWLKAENVAAHQRRARVLAFYEKFQHAERFRFECELLKPILDGAAILYVVDASHPYRPNFEAEFEILQWTGQPSLALINQSGDGQWVSEWEFALGQYFRKVLPFNAHSSRFRERLRLMEELRFLSDSARPALDEAMALLRKQHESRIRACALILSDLICSAVSQQLKIPLPEQGLREEEKQRAVADFFDQLRRMEKNSRVAIARTFQYQKLQSEETELDPEADERDLFGAETWEFMGLSRSKLIATGTAAGAVAGGTVDAAVGGASFLLGTGIGALLGSVSSGFFAYADPQLAGIKLSRKTLRIGPIPNPNFAWILLDRGLLFSKGIMHRTHAQRDSLRIEKKHTGPSADFSPAELRAFSWVLQKLRWLGRSEALQSRMAELIEARLRLLDEAPESKT